MQSLVPKTNAASISPQGLVLDRGSSLICMRAGTPNRIRVAACVGVARARGRVCVCICVGRVWSSGRWVAGRVRVWCWWRWGEGVVGVVPALAEGQGRHPGVIAGAIATGVDDVAPAVGGRIDQPGAVVDEHQAQGDAPEH